MFKKNSWSAFMLVLLFIPICVSARPFQYRSLPKAGTHLMMKTLNLITGNDYGPAYFTEYADLIHITYNERTIVHIRDLRDFFVAHMDNCDRIAATVLSGKNSHKGDPKYLPIHEHWITLTTEEKLSVLINMRDDLSPYPTDCMLNNIITANQLIVEGRSARREIIITRYEFLVGEKGGGSKEKQLIDLKNIAKFIGTSLSDNQISSIADNLWGLTDNPHLNRTFNKGKIGRWKECFTEENIREFKELWNDYLIYWEYEIDDSW